MASNIDSILNKITNENFDINVRAMKNLQNKIQNNLIALDKLPENTATKFLICYSRWLAYYLTYKDQYDYAPDFISRTLSLFKLSVEIFPDKSVENTKNQIQIIKLINDIGESNMNYREICDSTIQSLSRKGLINTIGTAYDNREQNNTNYFSNTVPLKNFGATNQQSNFQSTYNRPNENNMNINVNMNNMNLNLNNEMTSSLPVSNNINVATFKPVSRSNINDQFGATKKSTLNQNQNQNELLSNANTVNINNTMTNIETLNNMNFNKTKNKTTVFKSNTSVENQITKEAKMRVNDVFTPKVPSTFKKINLDNQEEEQRIFDIGVGLKLGDSLQKFDPINTIYTELLNDYPIEYFLQNEDILKSFFKILVECNFLEFGVICYKILDKMLDLIEKKIKENLTGIHCLYDIKDRGDLILSSDSLHSLETFLLYSMFSLINSIYDTNKMSFYIELIKKNFRLVYEILYRTKAWLSILYNILYEFDKVVTFYKNKNFNAEIFFNFLLEYYVNMDKEDFISLIEFDENEIEPLNFIKNLFFILPNSPFNSKIIDKLEDIKDDNDQVDSFLIDYNNAKTINDSIDLTRKMLSGQTNNEVIIANFYKILLSLKYLTNNSSDENDVIPKNISPLVIAITDFYIQNISDNLDKSKDLLIKLLSFKNMHKIENNLSIYNAILDEIKIKGRNIFPLFLNREILNIFLNDLTLDEYQPIILDIIYELYKDNPSIYNNAELKNILMLIPPFKNNLKLSHLQGESNVLNEGLNEGLMVKQLRLLFSKDEINRYSAIGYFLRYIGSEIEEENNDDLNLSNNSNRINLSLNLFGNEEKEENPEGDEKARKLKKNYEKLDSILLIKTITSEFMKIIKHARDDNSSSIDFMPLVKILQSPKMDSTMKISAIEQIIMSIKNRNYKDIFLNDILDYIIKEIKQNKSNLTNPSLGNYFVALLKLFNTIIYFYFKEDKIKQLINYKNSKELFDIFLPLILQKNTKHLLSAYSLMFLYFTIFFFDEYEGVMDENKIINFPVLKFFDKFYYVNLVPVQFVDIIENIVDNSMLNVHITKNVLDYIYYKRHPLNPIFKFDVIFSNINSLKSLTLLDVFISITQLFSCYSIYNDLNIYDALLQICFYYKKILPTSLNLKNLIMDTLGVLDIFLYQNQNIYNDKYFLENFIPFFQDYIATLLNYITTSKDFTTSLSDINIGLAYEILEFLIRNETFLPSNKINIVNNFILSYQNVFIFNQDKKLYKLLLNFIKFQVLFYNDISPTLPDKAFKDSISTISFFLSKYEPENNYNSLNYLIWALNYFMLLIKNNKCMDVINTKSFILVKLLQSPFTEVKVLSIKILTHLLNNEIFIKHGTILTDIFNTAKDTDNKIIKVNYYNFLIKGLEYILAKKEINNECDTFISEVFAVNEKIYDEKELIDILLRLNENETSFESCIELKYIHTCMSIDLENYNLVNNLFFKNSFYDNINDVLLKEIKILQYLFNIDILNNISKDYIMLSDKNLNYFFQYYNYDMKLKNVINGIMESTLNIKECINLIIKSIPLLTKETYDIYSANMNEIFLNLITYNQIVVKCWRKFVGLGIKEFIKVIQAYTLKYFTYLNYIFDSKFSFTNHNTQDLNNLCYDMMKFDENGEFFDDLRKMFGRVLPYLIEKNINKNILNNKSCDLKNDEDTLTQLMSTFNKIYKVSVDVYSAKMNCVFDMNNSNVKEKNDVVNSISSLIMTSMRCKKEFINLKYIETFISYIEMLNNNLPDHTLFNPPSASENKNTDKAKKINPKTTNQSVNINLASSNNKIKKINDKDMYIINEYENILVLFQNLFINFDTCPERNGLFFATLRYKFHIGIVLTMLHKIFYNVCKYPMLFENYLKLLINIISNNKGELTKLFVVSLVALTNKKESSLNQNNSNLNSSAMSNISNVNNGSINSNIINTNNSVTKEILLNIVLDYFAKNMHSLNQNFDLYVQFLKCLCQYKPISQAILKLKFPENIKQEILSLSSNKKTFTKDSKNIRMIEKLLEILIGLTFEVEQSKKIGNKEFINALGEILGKTNSEGLMYNILFFFRNICFSSSQKNIFINNQELFKKIIELLNGNTNIKIKFMCSHLLWVLLFNNQNLKTMLSKNEFKIMFKNLASNLQKEMDDNDKEENNKESDEKKNIKKKEYRKYLGNTCLNLKKILHIIEL